MLENVINTLCWAFDVVFRVHCFRYIWRQGQLLIIRKEMSSLKFTRLQLEKHPTPFPLLGKVFLTLTIRTQGVWLLCDLLARLVLFTSPYHICNEVHSLFEILSNTVGTSPLMSALMFHFFCLTVKLARRFFLDSDLWRKTDTHLPLTLSSALVIALGVF